MLKSQPTPKVFISYSHDSTAHKAWILTLATRLEGNGVAVTLEWNGHVAIIPAIQRKQTKGTYPT
nr:toll/interleukin-1 receptor domain-containing protein [Enterobacter hormaechei]